MNNGYNWLAAEPSLADRQKSNQLVSIALVFSFVYCYYSPFLLSRHSVADVDDSIS